MSFNRYSQFKGLNGQFIVPFAEIPIERNDRYEKYVKGKTRMDLLSFEYYNSADYGWLILQANPQYGSLEFNIPDGVEIRIPYPLNSALNRYQKSIEEYNKLYK
jgi:hypothetical protein